MHTISEELQLRQHLQCWLGFAFIWLWKSPKHVQSFKYLFEQGYFNDLSKVITYIAGRETVQRLSKARSEVNPEPSSVQTIYSCDLNYSTPLWKILCFCFREKRHYFRYYFKTLFLFYFFCKAIISSLNLLDQSLD